MVEQWPKIVTSYLARSSCLTPGAVLGSAEDPMIAPPTLIISEEQMSPATATASCGYKKVYLPVVCIATHKIDRLLIFIY